MTGTQTKPNLRSAPHHGLTHFYQDDWRNDIRKDAPRYNLNNVNNVNLGGDYSRNSQTPPLLFSDKNVEGVYFRDYVDSETFRKGQIEEKAQKERLAKEYTWSILVGENGFHQPNTGNHYQVQRRE